MDHGEEDQRKIITPAYSREIHHRGRTVHGPLIENDRARDLPHNSRSKLVDSLQISATLSLLSLVKKLAMRDRLLLGRAEQRVPKLYIFKSVFFFGRAFQRRRTRSLSAMYSRRNEFLGCTRAMKKHRLRFTRYVRRVKTEENTTFTSLQQDVEQ